MLYTGTTKYGMRDIAKRLQSEVVDTAERADVPLPRRRLGAGERLANTLGEKALDRVLEGTTFPLKLLRVAGLVLCPEIVAKIDTQVTQRIRAVKAPFFKASYDYSGLIPSNEKERIKAN